jgi:hypothetical protein
MGFGALWKKSGDEILPTSGINTIRIPGAGEYATIERTDNDLILTSSASGNANIVLDAGSGASTTIKVGTSYKFQVKSAGIGFFGAVPVGRIARPPVPAADVAQLKTSFDLLTDALVDYGLLE